jgi:hypothetical protein
METLSSQATDRIDEFTKKFVELKGTLDTGATVQGVLVSSRMLKKVDIISE